MSADLGFSDRVYGLGVGMFYITYVLFEIPGAIIAERWSARKWIARIMISWGIITALTGFVHTRTEFYAARFALGAAESSFFPAMIVYLTHWFRSQERGRAIACLYSAVPAASLVGSPLAGLLLGMSWGGMAGWRWLFILEGVPAVALGIATLFLLTDQPANARWLTGEERSWLADELQTEKEQKKKLKRSTMFDVLKEGQFLVLLAGYLIAMTGYLGNVYWIPTFVKRVSGFSNHTVTSLLVIPAAIGVAGMLFNGWHSDQTKERYWHTGVPLLAAGSMFFLALVARGNAALVVGSLLLGSGFLFAYLPTFWAIPTTMLSETAAAASFGLINSVGQLGGFAGSYSIGVLNERTHALNASFAFIALAYVVAGGLVLLSQAFSRRIR
jgi:sugar phosphate permease